MKIIIFGWFGAGNIGDEAILQAMLSFLKSQQELEFDIVSFNPTKTARLTAGFSSVKKIIKIGSKLSFLRSDFRGIYKSLKDSDAIIIGGGGLFQDIYNFYFIPFFTLIVIAATHLRKRILLYAIGIGPFKRKIAQWLCRMAANRAEYISVRDTLSRERLQELKIRQEVHLAPDPVFLLQPAKPGRASSILAAEGFNHKNSLKIGVCLQMLFKWDKRAEKVMAEALDKLAQNYKAEILFIPFGRYPNSWLNPKAHEVDVVASKKISDLMEGKSCILTREYTPDEIMAVIGEMDVIISMRFHGLIMSLVMGIPSIGLTYRVESKLSYFYKQLGFNENLFFINGLDKSTLLERIDNILDNYAKLQKIYHNHAQQFQKQATQGIQSLINQLFKNQKANH